MEPVRSRVLPWRHRPLSALLGLAWPIAVSMLSFGAMTFVDTLFVGRLGPSALAGVGLAGTTVFTVICFAIGLLRGVKTLVSQSIGAGRRGDLAAHLGAGLVAALVLGAAGILLAYLASLALPSIAASERAGVHAVTYLRIRALSFPVLLAFVAVREHRYGEGDTRTPMVASLAANVANACLDWLFIVHLEWGVAGSAWATVIGQGLELAILVGGSWTRLPRFAFRVLALRELFRVGAPTGVQFTLEVGSFALLTAIVSVLGEMQMAAHQIVLQVAHFSFLPALALGEAASVMAGQAVGAGRDSMVRRVARLGLFAASGYTGVWTLAMIAFAPRIVSLFTADPALAAVAVSLLRLAALFQVPDGAACVARGVLRGTGDVRVPALYGIACAWICTPPLAWLLGHTAGLGALGGWIGLALELTVLAAICWARLERGGWLRAAEESRDRLALVAA